jgi:hypothetical protein
MPIRSRALHALWTGRPISLRGQMPTAGKYIEGLAGQVSAMTSALRERSVDDIWTLLSLRRWYWG